MLRTCKAPARINPLDPNSLVVMMAPIVLLLMIVEVFLRSPMIQYGVSVDLPHAANVLAMPHADREDAITITVTRDGKTYLRSDSVSPAQLPSMIRKCLSAGAERKAYFKVDPHAKYSHVADALAGVRSAGIQNVGILVERRHPQDSAPQKP